MSESSYQAKVANIYDAFKQGAYPEALRELDSLEKRLEEGRGDQKRKGFVYYFKAIVLGKSYEFVDSINYFKKAIKFQHDAKDLYYEYGQVLYTDEQFEEARYAFKESIKNGFKRGISLYYIAYISSLMGEDKRAVKFFRAVHKLPSKEKKDILQAAEAQIAEIYLKRVLKKKDAVRKIEEYVIPQFEKALAIDPSSEQGKDIEKRIFEIKKRYELILLKMRNGRPVYYPRHFLRFLQTIGSDSNVAYQTDNAVSANPDTASSLFSNTTLLGRYTYTLSNVMFLSPEIGLGYKKYFKDQDTVKIFNSYNYSGALRASLEHKVFNKPASTLIDYSFAQENRFNTSDDKFTLFTQTHSFSIGERFEYFNIGTSIVRLNYSVTNREQESDKSSAFGISLEQIIKLSKYYSAFLYTSYTKNSSDNLTYENDQIVTKVDFILPQFANYYRPFFGVTGVFVNPKFQEEQRGLEKNWGVNFRLSRTLSSNTRLNLRYDYQMNISNDENYEYKKQMVALDFEAVF